jgi:hypothetical protein
VRQKWRYVRADLLGASAGPDSSDGTKLYSGRQNRWEMATHPNLSCDGFAVLAAKRLSS